MDSHAKKDVSTIITGVIIIFLFVSLTIFSLSKVLSIHDLFIIKENNNDALSYAAKHTNNYIICIASTLLIACVTSGAYAGTLMGIVDSAESLGFKNRFFVLIVNAIICIAVGTINPSIIKIISNLSVPIIIATVFIIPSVYFIKNGGYVMKATASFVLCSGITVLFFIYP
ncbi:hypothetical protein [Pectobacterium polaris]|uniref:hypothetical protein n=1 Tax=Pectobacterium polaris TaxID=2042057 RepID=UPI0006893A53|nr:hypothetical protein [Pectobacterium polaris]